MVEPGPASEPSTRAGRNGRRRILVHAIAGAVGLAALAALVRGVGAALLFDIVRALCAWLPLLIAVDAVRVVAEAAATYALSEPVRRRVPLGELCRVHLIAYAIGSTMPAGRAASEAVKAAMLARFIGAPSAAAVGVANQANQMLGSALGAVPCVVAALWLTGLSPLTAVVAAFVVVTITGVVLFQVACRSRGVGGALLGRWNRMAQATSAFHDAIERIPIAPPAATAAALVHRAAAVVQLGILLSALGGRHGVGEALLAQGVNLVGGAVGDLVPGQLGATDGAFALAAPYLGLALASGIAISVMLHCVQAFWAVIGWTVPLFWRAPAPAGEPEEAAAPPEDGLPPEAPVGP